MKMYLQLAGLQGSDEGICRAQQGGIYFYVLNICVVIVFALTQCSRMVTAVNPETELHIFLLHFHSVWKSSLWVPIKHLGGSSCCIRFTISVPTSSN